MRVVFFAFLLLFPGTAALSQTPPYHSGKIRLAEQEEELALEFRYDPLCDKLYYPDQQDGEGVYGPSQLNGFSWAGARYYSLPLAGGQAAFFKVLYEGNSFAVLQKEVSVSLIQYLCEAYPASFEAEEDSETGKLRLLYKSSNSFIADMGEEMELESATFIATPSGVSLFQLHTAASLRADDPASGREPEQGLQMIRLKQLFASQQQFVQAKKIIRGNDLKLISPQTIADTFRHIDALL